MVESKKKVTVVLENYLVESLIDYVTEMNKFQKTEIPITIKNSEPDSIEKKRSIKRWKKSIGYYYLNPDRFAFGLRDL